MVTANSVLIEVTPLKGSSPVQRRLEDHAQAPQVGPAVELFGPGLLRRHVAGSSHDGARLRQVLLAGSLCQSGQAEIEDLHASRRQSHPARCSPA